MNQGAEVNKNVFIAAIVAVVIIVCVGGYYIFFAKHDNVPEETRKAYMDKMRSSGPQSYSAPGEGGGGASGGPSSGGPSSN